MRKGFLESITNFQLKSQKSHYNCSAGFQTIFSTIDQFKVCSIFQLELTHSATLPKCSEGFQITNVVMVLQPHNSKLTIELLQDFQIYPSNELLQKPKLKLRTHKFFEREVINKIQYKSQYQREGQFINTTTTQLSTR